MELFVFQHAEWTRLYNCSAPDLRVDRVPLDQRSDQFHVDALMTGSLCLLFYVLYAPCLASIWRNCWCHGDNACYKLLFYIGVMDVAILWLLGFLHAWLSLEGAVFCSHPTLIYWAGLGVTSLWMAESTADLILAFNRYLELVSPKLALKLFAGSRIYLWLSASSLYALYWFLFEKPALFSGLHFAWFFDPFVGYREDSQRKFLTPMLTFHDTVVGVGSPFIYLLFAITLKLQSSGGTSRNISRIQKMIFLQVFTISALNTLACAIYLITHAMNGATQWLITLAQFLWLFIHGFPPVIYLCMNKTIRDDCRRYCVKIFPPMGGSRIHVTDGSRVVAAAWPAVPVPASNVQ